VKRNYDKYTDANTAKLNILNALNTGEHFDQNEGLYKKNLAYVAYPEYNFRSAQGAAFSVAKICRELSNDGLIRLGIYHRWYITKKGIASLLT
jgi:hypothetical protein